MPTLLKIQFTLPADLAEAAGEFIAAKVPHGWEETPEGDSMRFTIFLEDHSLGMEVVEAIRNQWPDCGVTHSEQESENWAMAWKDFFNPVNCGDHFRILPPWLDEEDDETMHIVIEPKMAFGTGHHPTTSVCLAAIGDLAGEGLIRKGQTFLDLGTGSGILGIGLCKLGLTGIGLDIDPQAIECARENLTANDVADAMELAVASADSLDEDEFYDVVVANILSGPLIEMAGDILPHVKPGGCLILSGILAEKQADAVAQTYARRGIGQPEIRIDGEWAGLIWRKVGA